MVVAEDGPSPIQARFIEFLGLRVFALIIKSRGEFVHHCQCVWMVRPESGFEGFEAFREELFCFEILSLPCVQPARQQHKAI
jgi:hypothetical protein